jgi:MFS family permease
MKPLNARLGPGKTILAGMCGTIAGWVLMPAIPAALFGLPLASAAVYAALVFVYDCSVMLFIIPYMALRAKVTPDDYMGRMIATMRFLTVATAPLGAMAAGYLADHYGVRTGMACIGAGGLLLAAAMIASPHIRSVRPD